MTYDQPPVQPAYTATPPAPAQPKSRHWVWITAAAVLAVLILGVGAYFLFGRNSGPTLTGAEATCNRGRSGGDIADGGKSLLIDVRGTSPGEQIRGAMDAETLQCILDNLQTPAAVKAHIVGTRALDGRQTDAWDGFEASWTYHPDSGLQMTIEQK